MKLQCSEKETLLDKAQDSVSIQEGLERATILAYAGLLSFWEVDSVT